MNFKLDENLPTELLHDLRQRGHTADTVPDQGLGGAPDPAILARVRSEGFILLTLDKGIADIRSYPPRDYPGIVLFRPPSTGRGACLAFIRKQLPMLLNVELTGHLLVVSEAGIRIR